MIINLPLKVDDLGFMSSATLPWLLVLATSKTIPYYETSLSRATSIRGSLRSIMISKIFINKIRKK